MDTRRNAERSCTGRLVDAAGVWFGRGRETESRLFEAELAMLR
jgi:hypothetical protein